MNWFYDWIVPYSSALATVALVFIALRIAHKWFYGDYTGRDVVAQLRQCPKCHKIVDKEHVCS